MTAIIAGQGLGLLNTSQGLIGAGGQIGEATQGRGGEKVYVNASNGNLIIQHQDEWLVGTGPDAAIMRTYNSIASASDDNGDNWRLNLSRRISGLTIGPNQTNSTVKRIGEDGAETVYTYDSALNAYVSKDGAGSFDRLTYNSASQPATWIWIDGDTQTTETYSVVSGYDARLTTIADADDNKITLTYSGTSNLITQIATTARDSGKQELITLTYDFGTGKTSNIKSMSTSYYEGNTQKSIKRVDYSYDDLNRLTEVRLDLTQVNANDSNYYTTTYTYDGSSKRIASVTQTDNSKLEIDYSQGRVKEIRQWDGTNMLSTSFVYNPTTGTTTVYDPVYSPTELVYQTTPGQASGQLLKIRRPANGSGTFDTTFTYDDSGNISSVTDARNNTTTYCYDAQGNRVYERDAQGSVIERVFSGSNLLLQQTTYTVPAVDGGGDAQPAGACTTHYIYDAKGHLRYEVSPEGRVTQHTFNNLGQLIRQDQYGGDSALDVSSLTTWSQGFGTDSSGLSPLPTQFVRSGGTLRVASTNQASSATQTVSGTAQPLGSMWRAEITTPAIVSNQLLNIGIGAGISGGSNYRQHSLMISGGTFSTDVMVGGSALPVRSLGTAKANTTYVVEVMTAADGSSTLNVYEKGKVRSSGFTDSRNLGGWSQPALIMVAYAGSNVTNNVIVVDDLSVRQPVESLLNAWASNRSPALSMRKEFTYNSRGQVEQATEYAYINASGTVSGAGTTHYVYDQAGNLLQKVDAKDQHTSYVYDGLNRITMTVDGEENLTTSSYIDSINSTIVTQANSLQTINTYDQAGRLISQQRQTLSKDLGISRFNYDYRGHQVMSTNELGETTFYLYDNAERMVGEIDSTGALTQYTYNNNDQLIQTRRWANKVPPSSLRALAANPSSWQLPPASLLSADFSDWTLGVSGSASNFSNGVDLSPEWQLEGESTAWLSQNGVESISSYLASSRVAVTAGQSYEISAYTGAHRATVSLEVAFYDNSGTQVDKTVSSTQYPAGTGINASEYVGGSTLYGYKQLWITAKAPNGAVFAEVRARKAQTNAGDKNSFMFVTRPYMAATGPWVSTSGQTDIRPIDSADDRFEFNLYDKAGRLAKSIDAVGAVVEYKYDAMGQLLSTTHYDSKLSSAKLTALRDTNAELAPSDANATVGTMFGRDRIERNYYTPDALLDAHLDADGYLTTYAYDSAGRLIKTTRYASRVNGIVTDTRGKPDVYTQAPSSGSNYVLTSPEDQTTYTFYNNRGLKLAEVDAEGYYTQYFYYANGQLQAEKRFVNKIQGSFDGSTRPSLIGAGVTPPNNKPYLRLSNQDRTQTYTYDGNGRLTSEYIEPEGKSTQYIYDTQGQLQSTIKQLDASRTQTTANRFDELGRLIGTLSAVGSEVLNQWRLDNPHALTSEYQAKADEVWAAYGTTYSYDKAGRLITTVSPDGSGGPGNKSVYYYDATGRQIYSINSLGEVTQYAYNSFGEIITQIQVGQRLDKAVLPGLTGGRDTAVASAISALRDDAVDLTQGWRYDKRGQVSQTIDALHNENTYYYNAFGEVYRADERISSTQAVRTTKSYDRRGHEEQVIKDGRTTKFVNYDAFGRVIEELDASGLNAKIYSYDRLGRQIATTDEAGVTTRMMTYDGLDRVLTIATPLDKGQSVQYTYDPTAGSQTITTAEGISTTSIINHAGQVVQVSDGSGHVTDYSYDVDGHLTGTTVTASGESVALSSSSRTYDKAGRLYEFIDERGTVTRTEYDAVNRVLSTTIDPTGLKLKTEYQYDAMGRAIWSKDAKGIWTRTEYDDKGRVAAVITDPVSNPINNDPYALNLRTEYTYDAQGHTLTVIRGAGTEHQQKTRYEYDATGRRKQEIVDPDDLRLTTTYTYDGNDNVVAKTDAEGYTTRYVYDVTNRQIYAVDGSGAVTHTEYDQDGRISRQTSYVNRIELGAVNKPGLQLAALGLAISESDIDARLNSSVAGDQVVRHVYDKDGRRIYSVDALGYVTQRTFDDVGNVIRVTRYAKQATGGLLQQDVLGDLLSFSAPQVNADPMDRTTQMVYDAAGRVTWVIDPEGYATANTYDAAGNLIQSTQYARKLQFVDANQALLNPNQIPVIGSSTAPGEAYIVDDVAHDRTTYSFFNKANLLTHQIDAENYLTYNVYRNGQLSSVTRYANKVSGIYDPDRAPKVVSSAAKAPSDGNYVITSSATASVKDTTTYYLYDNAGRLEICTDPEGNATTYQYDAANNKLIEYQNADSPDEVATKYTYDGAGRLRSETQAYGTDLASTTSFELNALGLRRQITDPAGHKTTQTFDALGRVIEVLDALDGKTETRYDAFGNVVQIIDSRDGQTFSYIDTPNNTVWSIDAEGYVKRQERDGFGNVVSSTLYANKIVGTPGVGAALPRAFASQSDAIEAGATLYVLKNAEHDQTTRMRYDRMGRLIETINAENFSTNCTYDAFGNKLTATNAVNGVHTYTYDRLGRKLTELLPEKVKKLDGSGNILLDGQGQAIMVDVLNRYIYDTRGNLILSVEASNLAEQRITKYKYDRLNRQIEVTGEAMDTYTVGQDTTPGTIPRTTTVYDTRGNVIEVKDPTGARTLTYWDALHRRTASVSPTGTLTTWTYWDNGLVHTETIYATPISLPAMAGGDAPTPPADAPENNRIKIYDYDANNRLIKVTTPSVEIGEINPATGSYERLTTDLVVTRSFDAAGNVVRETDARGNSSYHFFDKAGNQIASVDAERYVTRFTRDSAGQVLSQTRYATPISIYTKLGTDTDITNVITSLSTEGSRKTDYVLNRLGQVRQQIIRGVESAIVNADTGELTQRTADAITEYTYNGLGQVTQRKEATGEVLDWVFDREGRQTSALGARFKDYNNTEVRAITDTEYNGLGAENRTIERGLSPTLETDDHITRFVYGKNGYMSQKIDASGVITRYAYDAAGHVTRQWFDRNDADGLAIAGDSSFNGKLWIDRTVASTTETENGNEWVDLNGRTPIPAASDLTFTAQVTVRSGTSGRQFMIGLENTPAGAIYNAAGTNDLPASYRRLDVYFKDTQALMVRYRDANGTWQEQALSPTIPFVGGTYSLTIKLQSDRARLEIVAPGGATSSKDVFYKPGNTPAQEWGQVRAHMSVNQKAGVVTDGVFARDYVDNLKIVNSNGELFKEDFSTVSSQLEYVNNVNKAFWQVDANGQSGRMATDYTEFAYDDAGRQVQRKTYSTYLGNVDAQGKAIAYGTVTEETLYNAFGEMSTKGSNGGAQESAVYNKMGWLWQSNAENGVTKIHTYDANGNLTLKVTPSNNPRADNGVNGQLTRGMSCDFFGYDKNNHLTDTYTRRVDEPQISESGVWVPDGGPIAQGAFVSNPGKISSYFDHEVTTQSGQGSVTNHFTYLQLPAMNAYESGDIQMESHFYQQDGSEVWSSRRTIAPNENPFALVALTTENLSAPNWMPYYFAYNDSTGEYIQAASATITLSVNTKHGLVRLGSIDYPAGKDAAALANTRTLTLPTTLHLKSQPLETKRMVLMYRVKDSNDKWTFKAVPQMEIPAGTKVAGWFTLTDFTNIASNGQEYDFRYVALGAEGAVLNSQEGTLKLTGTTLTGEQRPREASSAGRAFMDSSGKINVTELGATATAATITVRQRATGATWSSKAPLLPATILGTTTNGWFQFDPALVAPQTGAYDYVIEAYAANDPSLILNKVMGSFIKGDVKSADVELSKYDKRPEMITLTGQPLAAVRGELLYARLSDPTHVSKTALKATGAGKFTWDALDLSLSLGQDTPYKTEFLLYDAAGMLVSRMTGTVNLGAAIKADLKPEPDSRPSVFYFQPATAAAKLTGSYVRFYYRDNPNDLFKAFDENVPLMPNDMYLLDISVPNSDVPDNGFVDIQYYYEVYNAQKQLVTTQGLSGAALAGVPTAATPAVFRYQPVRRPIGKVDEGWADPDQASHRTQTINAFGEVAQERDASGHITQLNYNAMGRLILKTDPMTDITDEKGHSYRDTPQTHYYYDLQGRLVGSQDANQFTTTYLLKADGNGQSTTLKEFHPDTGKIVNAYDVFNDLRRSTNEISGATDYAYDTLHRQTRVDHVARANSRGFDRYVYDAAGNRVQHFTDGANSLKPISEDRTYFDASGRVIKRQSAQGRVTVTRYEDGVLALGMGGRWVSGSRTSTTDPNGRSTIDTKDHFGRVTQHTDLGGHTTYYAYDALGGGLTGQVSSQGQQISYSYYDDGRLKAIHDIVLNTVTVYAYDIAGNRTFEGYATTDGSNFYQKAIIKYDELNRIKNITDPLYTINYQYDAVGNRRRVRSSSTDGAPPADLWYRYDAMNRFVISMGRLNGDVIEQGTTGSGVKIAYDLAGNRKQADYADGHSEQYKYTEDGYLTDTLIDKGTGYVLAAARGVDLGGRVRSYTEYSGTSLIKDDYYYNDDSRVTSDWHTQDGNLTVTGYHYEADGTVKDLVTGPLKIGSTQVYTYYEYEWWDSALVKQIKAIAGEPDLNKATDWNSGTSNYTYDVNGNVKVAQDVQGGRSLRYVTNAQGLILFRDEVKKNESVGKRQTYFYVDGQRIGETGNDAGSSSIDYAAALAAGSSKRDYKTASPVNTADFDQSYQAINSHYPGFTASGYTVRSDSETLKDVALKVWGDGSLWYLIAEANGMSNSTALKANQVLEIPNKVTNIHNNSQTHQTYNAGEAMGDTSPSFLAPPTRRSSIRYTPPPPPPPLPKKRSGGGAINHLLQRLISHAVGSLVSPMADSLKAMAMAQEDELLKKRIAAKSAGDESTSYSLSGEREHAQSFDSLGLDFMPPSLLSGLSFDSVISNNSFLSSAPLPSLQMTDNFSFANTFPSDPYISGLLYDTNTSANSVYDYNNLSIGGMSWSDNLYSGLYNQNTLLSPIDYSFNSVFDSPSFSNFLGYGSYTSSFSDPISYSNTNAYNTIDYGSSGVFGAGSLLNAPTFSGMSSGLYTSSFDNLLTPYNQYSTVNYDLNNLLNTGSLLDSPSFNDPFHISGLSSNVSYEPINAALNTDWLGMGSSLLGNYVDPVMGMLNQGWNLAGNTSSLYPDTAPYASYFDRTVATMPLASLYDAPPLAGIHVPVDNRFDTFMSDVGLAPSGPTVSYVEDQLDGLDALQMGLTVASMIPVVGVFAGAANAAIDAYKGNYGSAALSLAAMVPGVGIMGAGAKMGGKIVGAAERIALSADRIGYNAFDNFLSNSTGYRAFEAIASNPQFLKIANAADQIGYKAFDNFLPNSTGYRAFEAIASNPEFLKVANSADGIGYKAFDRFVGGATTSRLEVSNGYLYRFDDAGRATHIEGQLLSNAAQGRSAQAQLGAGGSYRLPTDEGGHFVGRRFDGPLDDFNHFAQDRNFNRGAYKALENGWQRALDKGQSVYVDIKPSYPGASLRPDILDVTYTIDSMPYQTVFKNRPGGR